MSTIWLDTKNIESKHYKCGYCGNQVASEKGWYGNIAGLTKLICICHKCGCPTYFDGTGKQFPGPSIGNDVMYIPSENVIELFKEARKCYSINAYGSVVMCCRKLLMNIAVDRGAEEGKNYYEYVTYLNDNNYIPPNGRDWVDEIRNLGNTANHRIEFRSQNDAKKYSFSQKCF